MMKEVTLTQLKQMMLEEQQPFAIYFYTPLCGTCKIGMRMLDIVLQTDPNITVVQININFVPDLAVEWKIESVPCLAVFKSGALKAKWYDMQSVQELFKRLKEELK